MNKTPTGWRVSSLAELTSSGLMADGDWIESKDQDPEGEVRLIQLADIGDGVFLERSRRYLTRENAARLNCTYLEPDDILIARMPDPIGRAAVFPGLPYACVTAVDVCIIRPNRDVNIKWLSYSINSGAFRRSIERRTTGTTRKRISRSTLADIELAVPPLPEQRKIAQILSTWDEAIAAAEQLVAALQRRKKGLMQRLLTGQVRFPEFESAEWEDVELGDHLTPVLRTEPVEAGKEYRLIGVRWYLAGAHIHDVVPGDKIVTHALSRIEENDILYNKMWVSKAAFAVAKREHAGAYGSGEYPQFIAGDGIDVRFIEYAFHDPRFLHDAKALCRGTTGRIRLHPDDFLRLRMRLPSRSEQGKIAEVLQIADQEIDAMKQYLDGLRSQKKGLMQRLLTGQVRVQV